MNTLLQFLSALWLFVAYLFPIARWAMNTIHDGKVEPHEVQALVVEFWPERDDLTGEPIPIRLPWGRLGDD